MGCIPTPSTLCYLINFLSCKKTVEINKLLNCVINQVDEISGYRSAVRLAMIAEDIVVVEGPTSGLTEETIRHIAVGTMLLFLITTPVRIG